MGTVLPITPEFHGTFTNNGELILNAQATAEFFGDYLGAGTIDNDGTIIFHGLGPGASPANIEVAGTGTIELAGTASTTIELGGTERGTFHGDPLAEYDSMTFVDGGSLELGGTLDVQLISPDGIAPVYAPGLGDSFMIFMAGEILGDFNTPLNLPTLAAGLKWLVVLDAQSYALQVSAVPIPHAIWLFGSGLGLLMRRRRGTT